MMRALLFATAMLAGCGAGVGGPCSFEDPCDEGVCDLTDPMGPTCIDSDGDIDGDGIRNGEDFCSHQDGGDLDEDRDGLGDVCDRCPTAPPASKPDTDADEVDAPCDPEPGIDGDKIVVFEGFNGGLPTGWKATPGWQFAGGEAIATPADPIVSEQLTVLLPLVSQHVAVLSEYTIDGVDPDATLHFAGVVAVDQRPAGGSVVQCTGTRTGTVDLLSLDTDTENSSKTFTNLFNTTSLYRLGIQLDNAQAACAMIAGPEIGAAQAGTGGQVMNEAGITVRGATVRFHHLLIVQREP